MLRLSDSRPSTGSYEASSFLDTLIRQPNHRRAAVLAILLTGCPPTEGETETSSGITENSSITTNNPTLTSPSTVTTGMTTNDNDTSIMGSTSMPEPETTAWETTDPTTGGHCEGAPKYGECTMPNEKDPACNGSVCSNCTEECLCINGAKTFPEDEEPCTSCDRDNGYIKKGENPDGSPICEIYVPKPPTVNRMPQGNDVMAIVPNVIVTGSCEPVDHVQWSFVLEENEAEFDWENNDNWENVTNYIKNETTWELTPDLPKIGVYKTCFRTVKYGVTSANDAVCFRMERVV